MMKNALLSMVFTALLISACSPKKPETTSNPSISYMPIGATISADKAMSNQEMMSLFANMKVGDTIQAKFSSKITEVCSKKGCWMTLPLGDSVATRVTFKDYGFFMPLDAAGKDVVVDGIAFIQETSVADLKHFAQDAGKSQEEIDAITSPKISYSFEAKGVLLQNK